MPNKFILLGVLALVASILFVGVYENDEFSEVRIFTKHKPSTQLFFYSPAGGKTLSPTELSEELQNEELAYQEFVVNTGVIDSKNNTDFAPYLLIQLSLSLFTLGFYKVKYKTPFEKFVFPLHFIINFLVSSFMIGGMLSTYNIYGQLCLLILVLIANYLTIFWIRNEKIFAKS